LNRECWRFLHRSVLSNHEPPPNWFYVGVFSRAGGGGDKKVTLEDFKPNKEIGAFLKLVPLLGACFFST
jgi:hypothetical protein